MPSVLDQIRKLEEQKRALLQGAKDEALKKANEAIAELRELGFNYRLAEMDGAAPRTTGGRRTGIREEVLSLVKTNPGISRAKLLELMNAKGDKSAEQSISNALAAHKKAGTVTLENGTYKAK